MLPFRRLRMFAVGDVGEKAHIALSPVDQRGFGGNINEHDAAVFAPTRYFRRHGLVAPRHGLELGQHMGQ